MGSMALQLRPFTVPDPLETYGRAMSLRALMDERRYRALREQQAQQKIADEEREIQEREAFQRGYAGLPEGATLKQIVGLPGGTRYGIPVFTQQRQAEEAALKAKTAGFTQQRTELELKGEKIKQARGQMQQYIRDLEYIDALPPEQQSAAYDALKAEYVQRGEPVDPNAPLPSDVERAALKKRFFDADTLLGEQAKALDIQLKEGQVANIPLGTREQVAKTEKAEKELAGTAPPTGTLREFKDVYYPGWLQQKGITTPTARDEMNAYSDFRELLRARIGGVPGVDVTKPQAVIDQETAAAAARAKAIAEATAGTKPGNLAAFKTKSLALKNLEDAITAYKTELEKVGPTFRPEKGARLKSLFTDLQMKTKSLFELGVITGPDMQILQGAITDPTGVRGNFLGTSALLEQLGVLRSSVQRSKTALNEVYGQGGEPGGETPPPAPTVQWERGPDGKPRKKQ